ncbi:MAG: DegT/DnrJ/EryC1/StrS family aminotransferase [Bacteroidales bacterium]|jgi:dTDP-4-amino-4,6-dideoxygalactose transaminase|nr:DegT/DnrJ/EryC1/StrS family aminotransferase [Bacteroidales bacterium]HOL96944.1 DegT/DnrJ/EryC1/StrS family aminotransferase [Bacteroidales bacterium]HOM36457.1 DegT/DnrJ/EryC1/StrS family aminotransferase [Bacteroidales bacterium]HPD23968.1 DegT/DnrJ/EryC1/StrS family aminotransferase [Bacteroidales bacterium]HRS98501.1 DegT/DnrJ/EryC1/StrS family aminotransferase [Bacteroidales bacterium]
MNIPFNNLKLIHNPIKEEILSNFSDIIDNSAFVGGKYVEEFEKTFAEKLGTKHCIGVSNGTIALWVAMKACRIGIGDEVILPANTFFACAEAVEMCGAIPVFVDNDEYFNIDITKIEKAISPKTRMIMAVHLYGQACEIQKISAICKKHNLLLLEDCSQAHFSKNGGKYCGTYGDIATFSFYPGKNLGAFGDAGSIVTNDDILAERCRLIRNHGEAGKSNHVMIGFNCRMNPFQAVALNVKLRYIDDWNTKRKMIADMYQKYLGDCEKIILPKIKPNSVHTFHLFVILAEDRQNLRNFLTEKGIATGIHYPIPLPFISVYKDSYVNKEILFPNAINFSSRILSLPIFPGMTEEQIKYVCENILSFFSK